MSRLAYLVDGILAGASEDRVGGAELPCELELRRYDVDGHDALGARENRPQQRGEADAAQPEHRNRVARRDPRGVDHRTDPGEDRAPKQCRDLEREVVGDPDGGRGAHYDMVGEGGDAEVVVDRGRHGRVLAPAPFTAE